MFLLGPDLEDLAKSGGPQGLRVIQEQVTTATVLLPTSVPVTRGKALVTRSDALVTNSFFATVLLPTGACLSI